MNFLNTTLETDDYDYVVASDTDSIYLRLGNLVDKTCSGKSTKEIVDYLDKASEKIILPFIKKQYDDLAVMMSSYENKMVMEREVIADSGVWTAKKRYMLNVHNSEGVPYEQPKLKIMGIETTRSSTPQVVRTWLKEAIRMVLQEDEETVISFIDNVRTEFNQQPPENIAFPRSVNNLKKWERSCEYLRFRYADCGQGCFDLQPLHQEDGTDQTISADSGRRKNQVLVSQEAQSRWWYLW